LKGWLVRGPAENGAVVLMHGINTNRLTMLSRARFLAAAGYSVLLFDFQSHGESIGRHHTFGYLESLDARAACDYLTSRLPDVKKGVIGTSLGGAAAVLGPGPLDVQALVLEAVYPTIEEATANRIARRLGEPARLLTPLLVWQLRPRLGVSARQLRPIDRIGGIRAPLLLIAGGADKDTTPLESQRLFDAAPQPKEYWEIAGAAHQDFYLYAPKEYEARVLAFLGRYLRSATR
ncbi:MAG TPA: alpha/beta fold hydrolase, partial [Patescibacteria group bacterium]|nr:alpha/beta fold hydrolase [Patescibacteria group bacterium]